ncbi:formate/nitrite transporter family protein [Aerococcus viridans]|uniref:formate/nitrite transporter family protein n=1 Tax=Aerococcus viridans TaxID=1377 RepID=UPI0028FD14BF|nr:formate/nitrite transporter family protein [Aerococcus viridans]
MSEKNVSTFMDIIDGAVAKKDALFAQSKIRYLLRAIYAGIFLTLPTAIGILVWDVLSVDYPALGKISYALIFPIGLAMIVYLNGELATSNMMYLFTGAHRRKISWSKALTIILVCTLMNLLGAMIVGILIGNSSAAQYFNGDSAIMTVINAKLNKDIWTLFIDGILANIFVNITIMGQMKMKDDTARLLFIVAVIFLFVYGGFEHVIANFSLMSLAFFSGNNMNLLGVLVNWLVVFLGNLVGGGVMMGLGYSFLNNEDTLYLD